MKSSILPESVTYSFVVGLVVLYAAQALLTGALAPILRKRKAKA